MMNRLFLFFTLVSAFGLNSAFAQECAHRIYFLPQSHPAEDIGRVEKTQDVVDGVARSQLNIAHFVERFPGTPVFSENAGSTDMSVELFPPEKRAEVKEFFTQFYKEHFPDGLPQTFEKLTAQQKEDFYNNQAETILMMAGKIQKFRRVIENPETAAKIFPPIAAWTKLHPGQNNYPPEIGRLVYETRERQALVQINKFLETNPKQRDVILIFGSNHSFYYYPDLFPPQCIQIPSEFLADWGGRFREGPLGFPKRILEPKGFDTKSSR